MSQYWILAAILLPMLGSILIPLLPFGKRKYMLIYTEAIVIITSVIVGALLLNGTTEVFHVVHFVNDLSISFKIDGADEEAAEKALIQHCNEKLNGE